MPNIALKRQGFEELGGSLANFKHIYHQFVSANLETLGRRTMYLCEVELEDVRYTGYLAASFIVIVDPEAKGVEIFPLASHAIYIRMGTRPHWCPIGPLKPWALMKLGDEKAAYAVQRSIADFGTSRWQLYTRGMYSNPWPLRVIARSDFQVALRHTSDRIGQQLASNVLIPPGARGG